jgi:type VII secretion protein EccB
MSSKKDLVEAHAFNRRRLITAFVSGAPGGREVEPVRYGRTLVGGLVLAGLVVVGAAVSPLLRPALPKDWQQNGLVVGKESGSRFVAYKGTLYPVINTASARLVLGTEGGFKVNYVPEAEIAKQKQGATIGIPGAPDLLPSKGSLIQSGWSACTNARGDIKVDIVPKPQVAASRDAAYRVATPDGKQSYVITGDHKYPVPAGAAGNQALRALGLDGEEVRPAAGLWLDLVPTGSPLEPFGVKGEGGKADTGSSDLDTVGTPVRLEGRGYVLGKAGLLPVSEFAYTLYRSSGPGANLPEQKVDSSQVAKLRTVNDPDQRPYPQDWPQDDVSPFAGVEAPCLLMTTSPTSPATVRLAAPTDAESSDPGAQATSPRALGAGLTRNVASGHGALVQTTSAGVIGSGTTFLVDATGTRFAVGQKGSVSATLTALGYQDVRPAPVPSSWMDVLGDGPALTSTAAARTPGSQS